MNIVEKKLTVGELIEILQQHDPNMFVTIDNGHEEACSDYIESATVFTVQEADPEYKYYDDIPGHVGEPRWMGCDTPEFEVINLNKATSLI